SATISLVAPDGQVLTSDLAGAGQRILLSKGCALSSTAILAMRFPNRVKIAVGIEGWQRACEQFYELSVLPEALAAFKTGKVIAMHDVTEGGVMGAVYELCRAAGCGVRIDRAAVPVAEHTGRIAEVFGF